MQDAIEKNVGFEKGLVKSTVARGVLICSGWAATVAGVLGIFLPLLPTVPLLLLAAFCFSKSSERFHTWLVQHKRLGALIRDYLGQGAIPMRSKVLAIGMIWLSISISVILMQVLWVKFLLLTIAVLVTSYLLSRPTLKAAGKTMGDPTEEDR